ncbi:MAG: hypothetical protein LBS32_07230 [Clostridiales Family XIII bacterium]|jgi:hypothetical protein|nr:hypothetical protein [Clostridiales Family XIII bacterium]
MTESGASRLAAGALRPFLASRRGSFTVEAAIFLPVFIIGVLTVAYLLKMIAVQENVFHALTDEARAVAAEAVAVPYPVFFGRDLMARISEENGDELENARMSAFAYRFSRGAYTEQVEIRLDYDIGVKLPDAAVRSIPVSDILLFRAFVGADNAGPPLRQEDLEAEKESFTVWIFPRSGAKYHGEDCSYIEVWPREMALSDSLRRKYEPCGLCKPKDLSNGSLVYCFTTSGEVFHRGGCTSVDRYVVPIQKDEAEARGYTACARCGGR